MSHKFYSTNQGHARMAGLPTVSVLAKPAKKSKGTPSGNPPLLTDEQILEVRALSQFAGWGRAALAKRYGVKADMIDRVLSGITRSRLVATRKHLPADVEAA